MGLKSHTKKYIQGILDSRDGIFTLFGIFLQFQRILTEIVKNKGTNFSFLFLVKKKSILYSISLLQKKIFKVPDATSQTEITFML
jgi:hypothetical protein